MNNTATISIIELVEESRCDNSWVVKGKNLPELILHGRSLTEIYRIVPKAIKGLFKLNYGTEVEVFPVVKSTEFHPANMHKAGEKVLEWAVVPTESLAAA